MRRFSNRIKEHMTSVEKKDKTMGLHYTQPNHSKAYFRAQIIEKVSPCLLEREDYWIKKLDTKYHMASIFMTRITSRLYQFSFYSTNCSSFLFFQCRWTLIQFCMCRWTLKVCAYMSRKGTVVLSLGKVLSFYCWNRTTSMPKSDAIV